MRRGGDEFVRAGGKSRTARIRLLAHRHRPGPRACANSGSSNLKAGKESPVWVPASVVIASARKARTHARSDQSWINALPPALPYIPPKGTNLRILNTQYIRAKGCALGLNQSCLREFHTPRGLFAAIAIGPQKISRAGRRPSSVCQRPKLHAPVQLFKNSCQQYKQAPSATSVGPAFVSPTSSVLPSPVFPA